MMTSFFLPDLAGAAPSTAAAVDMVAPGLAIRARGAGAAACSYAVHYSKRPGAGRREKGHKGGCLDACRRVVPGARRSRRLQA
jgi:hypothetical protein